MSDLAGKVVLITGGARGLGREFALHLAKVGAVIGIIDIDLDESSLPSGDGGANGSGILEQLDTIGATSFGCLADVTDERSTTTAVDEIAAHLGPISGLITAAGGRMVERVVGVPPLGPAADQRASGLDMERTRRVFDVNVFGTMNAVKAVVPSMIQRGHGRIVTVGSVNGLHGRPFGTHADYSSAKAAVTHYTRYLAADVGRYGISANCLAPGLTFTDRNRSRYEGKPDLTRHLAIDRLAVPSDHAGAVAFLLSDAASYITGATLEVSGGTRVAWWGPEQEL
jgi:3-oxoacyl-[acyl-carrier protein] reductase